MSNQQGTTDVINALTFEATTTFPQVRVPLRVADWTLSLLLVQEIHRGQVIHRHLKSLFLTVPQGTIAARVVEEVQVLKARKFPGH
jgi:hypothetical protein